MVQTIDFYWYGLAALAYLVTCWIFSAVRKFHVCQAPKDHWDYIWPDRKMQVSVYLCATFLLPYVLNPTSEAAWLLEKSYFPCTYYFYCGMLLFCFFGSVKQWNQWKIASWIAGIITLAAMLPIILNAWIPGGLLTAEAMRLWEIVITVVSIVMMCYAGLSMWQVWQWMEESRDENYSNPEDFPTEYAHRVWLAPLFLTPLLWPAYLFDSPKMMAIQNILLAISNIVLLLNVMPAWRRTAILSDTNEMEVEAEIHDEMTEERTNRIAAEIEQFVKTEKGYLDAHLKLENVVDHCSYSRSYVSKAFQERFGGFSDYVNKLRLEHFDSFIQQNPMITKEAAAQASGFTSYRAYHRSKERLQKIKPV